MSTQVFADGLVLKARKRRAESGTKTDVYKLLKLKNKTKEDDGTINLENENFIKCVR